MSIRIVILQQGSPQIVEPEWWEGPREPREDMWEASSCCWPERILEGWPEPMEVFLCVDRETLAEGYDVGHLRDVVRRAHEAMWGAEVRVVVDQRLQIEGQRRFRDSREEWFRMLLENRLSDILELPIDPSDNTPFAEAAARSRRRCAALAIHSSGGWKCLLHRAPDPTSEVESFLAPFLVRTASSIGDGKCLVVLRDRCDEEGMKFIRAALESMPRGYVSVGVIDEVEDPPLELEAVCQEAGCSLIRFRGLFELQFFLRKLNEPSGSKPSVRAFARQARVMANRLFVAPSPQLLVTHSFVAGDPSACHAAARDTWQLTRAVPEGRVIKINPAVQCISLPNVLEQLRHLVAWVHIGHGTRDEGLQQAGGVFKTAEEWLKCFAGYRSSLALAVFSSCQSENVAYRFAEAGVGVTVGFVNSVPKNVCGLLTSRVVAAALRSNGERDEILEAFRQGCDLLAKEYSGAEPVSFWAQY